MKAVWKNTKWILMVIGIVFFWVQPWVRLLVVVGVEYAGKPGQVLRKKQKEKENSSGCLRPMFKLRQVLEGSDVKKCLQLSAAMPSMRKRKRSNKNSGNRIRQFPVRQAATAAMQNCATGTYVSMVITYPAEVVNPQVVWPDPAPELEGLQRVSISISDNSFPKIFSLRHVEFLD